MQSRVQQDKAMTRETCTDAHTQRQQRDSKGQDCSKKSEQEDMFCEDMSSGGREREVS